MERLIEKYMALPNQAWDNIIREATRVWSQAFLFSLTDLYNILGVTVNDVITFRLSCVVLKVKFRE